MRLPNDTQMPARGNLRLGTASFAAAGNSQATGTALVGQLCPVTAADGTKGVVLPTPKLGTAVYVLNTVANAVLKVYPASGGQINAAGANAAVSLGGGQGAWFIGTSSTQWYAPAFAFGADSDELAYLSGLTPGTVTASKAVVVDANKAIAGFTKVTSSVAGLVAGFVPLLVQQDLTGAGAANLTTFYTALTNNGANAITLADGTVTGQLKKIKMVVDPGTDSTLTFNATATIVFADVGDYAILVWDGSDWIPIELGNDADGTSAPVYTPA